MPIVSAGGSTVPGSPNKGLNVPGLAPIPLPNANGPICPSHQGEFAGITFVKIPASQLVAGFENQVITGRGNGIILYSFNVTFSDAPIVTVSFQPSKDTMKVDIDGTGTALEIPVGIIYDPAATGAIMMLSFDCEFEQFFVSAKCRNPVNTVGDLLIGVFNGGASIRAGAAL